MATMVSRPSKLRIDDWYFTGMSVVVLGIVLLGFARTYYLAGAIHAPLPSVIIHIHAVAFSSWIVLLIAQTLLVTWPAQAGTKRLESSERSSHLLWCCSG